MNRFPNPSFTQSISALRRILLQRAFWFLGGFTIVTLLTVLPPASHLPRPQPSVLPARILFVVGTILWLSTLVACLQTFALRKERPSFIASFTFFLFLGTELRALALAAQMM